VTSIIAGAAGGAFGAGITKSETASIGFAAYSSAKARVLSFAWNERLTREDVIEELKRELLYTGAAAVKTLTKSGGFIQRSISSFFD